GGIQSYRILVQGNDFHNTAVGVLITGQAISAFIDLGGGLHGSLGGNDFRGFTASRPAIDDEVGGANLISARQNIFSSGLLPASVVVASSGDTLDVAEPLSDERAFVQTLYNQTLGRSGTLPELDPWVSLLGTQGQAAVVNGIAKSAEALGRVVDQLYLRFLGRESDASGRSGWIGFLQGGGKLEAGGSLVFTLREYIRSLN